MKARKALFIALILIMALLHSPLAMILLAYGAEMDYISSFPTTGNNFSPLGICTDGTFIWVSDYGNDYVYKYFMNGTYTGTRWYAGGQTGVPSRMTTDGTNIWIVTSVEDRAFKYNMAGNFISSWLTTGQTSDPTGITTDGSFIWIIAQSGTEVWKYFMNGTYTGDHWDTSGQGGTQQDLTQNGEYFWLSDYGNDEVWKYYWNGTYTGDHWDISGQSGDSRGISLGGGFFWIVDGSDDAVYKYEGPPENVLENEGIISSDSTVDDEQWFFLNASIEISPDTSTFLFNRIDIDPEGLNMSCSYTNSTDTFAEENDPNNYLQLDDVVSVKTDLNNTFVRVDYYLRLHHEITKDGLFNVTVYSTASGGLNDTDTYLSVFTLTIRTPTVPIELFGAGFNASSPYVELYWNHDLLIYDLFEVRNSSDHMEWDYLGQNTTTQYTDFEVVNGTERYYIVRACRDTGVGWKNSSWSAMNFEKVYFISGVSEVFCKIRNYNATSIAVIAGTLNDGNLESTYFVDGDWYNVSEVNEIPGLDIRFNFTDIGGNPNCGCLDVYHSYSGHPQHDVQIQVWNFTSLSWRQIGTLIYNETAGWECSGLGNNAEHFFHNGSFWGRFYHIDQGHTPHEVQIDQIRLDVIYGAEFPAIGAVFRPEGWVLTIMIAAIGVPLIILGTRRRRR